MNVGAQGDPGYFASVNEPPAARAATEILHRDGRVTLSALANGKRRLRVEPSRPGAYVPRAECHTAYPDWLIRIILEAKGLGYLCDEIMRDEDPTYIRRHLELTVTAHVDPQELAGGEVLDFGCGAGASTVILSKLLPSSKITGVELSTKNLSIARARAQFYGLKRTRLMLSPGENALPEGVGPFRAIMLSAVFEHLLPAERRTLLPMLWGLLEPGGVLFIDETPSRWFPIETHTTGLPFINYLPDRLAAEYARRCSRTHTTGLPFINYLPDRLAAEYARRCSRRVRRDHSWDTMCRNGIRGGSVREILGLLPASDGRPILLEPHGLGIKDPLDLWFRGYAEPGSGRVGAMKRKAVPLLRIAARFVDSTSLVPYLSLAIRKAGA